MSISADTRRLVRDRAHFACEFCTVTETDTGGELTVDYTNNKRLCCWDAMQQSEAAFARVGERRRCRLRPAIDRAMCTQ